MSGGFDPCECAFSQEAAMRRLLSLLRQSQSYCTDTECDNMPVNPNTDDPVGTNTMMMMLLAVVFALVMYGMRPNSLRNQPEPLPEKPARQSEDNNDDGPGPSGIS